MWSAFLTGAAKQATTLIEERDKEIRDTMNVRMNEMYKRAEVAKREAEERRNELTGLANELVGVGFNEREAAYLLQNPEQAKKIIAYADKTGGITAEKKQQLFSKNKEHLNALEGETPQDYIKRVTTLGRGERPSIMAPGEMEGAFGIGTRAGQRSMSEFLARTGRTEEELLATELPARGVRPLGLDMTALAGEKSFEERMDDAQLAMLNNPPGSAEHTAAQSVLMKGAAIKEAGKARSGEEKLSDIRAAFKIADNSILRQTIGRNDSIIVSEDRDGTMSYRFRPKTKADVIDGFNKARAESLRAYAIQTYGDRSGRLPKDVQDILRAYTVETKVVLGDTNKIETPSAPPAASTPKPAAPRMGQGSKPAVGVPEPKTQQEYDDLPSGTQYRDTDGKLKVKS